MDAQPQPTLLVFTLGAAADRARRPVLPGRLRGAELGLRRAWLDSALAAGRRVGCRLAVSSPRPGAAPAPGAAHLPQRGSGFGRRFAAALDDAFALAAGGSVVVVGSDVPGLAAAHLRAALDHLAADPERVVVGPSPDGGFYLLAAARPIPGLADRVRWCGSDALASLRRALAAEGREVVAIDTLADLDRPADLVRWLADHGAAWRSWVHLLRGLLARLRRPPAPGRLGLPRTALAALPAGRGPPPRLRPSVP